MLKTLHFGSAICLALLLNLSGDILKGVWAETADDKSEIILPSRRVGGGTRRDSCIATKSSLVALVPEETVGKTTAAFPSFFFYLPEMEPAPVEFVLRDQADRLVYEKTFSSANYREGIIQLSLPSSELEPLKLDSNYRWYFSIICDPQNRAQDVVVEGLIRRVDLSPSLAEKLQTLSPLERVDFYQQADIWYEVIASIAQSPAFHTREALMMAKWSELLHSIGLDSVAQEQMRQPDTDTTTNSLSRSFKLGRSSDPIQSETVH